MLYFFVLLGIVQKEVVQKGGQAMTSMFQIDNSMIVLSIEDLHRAGLLAKYSQYPSELYCLSDADRVLLLDKFTSLLLPSHSLYSTQRTLLEHLLKERSHDVLTAFLLCAKNLTTAQWAVVAETFEKQDTLCPDDIDEAEIVEFWLMLRELTRAAGYIG